MNILLILGALACAFLAGLTVRRGGKLLFRLTVICVIVLILAGLACMLSYGDIVLLLLPALGAAGVLRRGDSE